MEAHVAQLQFAFEQQCKARSRGVEHVFGRQFDAHPFPCARTVGLELGDGGEEVLGLTLGARVDEDEIARRAGYVS